MKKYFRIKKLYQFLLIISLLNNFNLFVNAIVFDRTDRYFLPGEAVDCNFDADTCEFGGKVSCTGRGCGSLVDLKKTCIGVAPRVKDDPTTGTKYASLCLPPNVPRVGDGTNKGTRISCQLLGAGSGGLTSVSVANFIREEKDPSSVNEISKLTFTSDIKNGTNLGVALMGNCYLCGTDGKGNEATCQGFETSTTTIDCEIPTFTSGTTCTFGGAGGKKNCYDAQLVQSRDSLKFLCGGSSDKTGKDQGDLVVCTRGNPTNNTVFDVTSVAGGVKKYTLKKTAKDNFGCEYKNVTASNTCKLEKAIPTCSFGPKMDSLGTNCGLINQTYSDGGKYYYCSPDNFKVECDEPLDYTQIFQYSGTVGDRTWSSTIKVSSCRRFVEPLPADVNLRNLNPLSPLGLIRTISSTLYYFAIFYFIMLILINAISYVRSGEDPSKLKQIKESLFNTVAGFIFVIASGGVILYIINSFNP